jgi:hypothetical protein
LSAKRWVGDTAAVPVSAKGKTDLNGTARMGSAPSNNVVNADCRSDKFSAKIVWLGEQRMLRGRSYIWRCGPQTAIAQIGACKRTRSRPVGYPGRHLGMFAAHSGGRSGRIFAMIDLGRSGTASATASLGSAHLRRGLCAEPPARVVEVHSAAVREAC